MTDSWHVLGDYLGACIVVASVLAALHYRARAVKAEDNEAKLEQTVNEILADPPTPRSGGESL